MATSALRSAAMRLLRLHRHQHYHHPLCMQSYYRASLAAHCRPGVPSPVSAPLCIPALHRLRPFMSSPASRTAAGEQQPGADGTPEPCGYTGEEWDAASDVGKLQLMLSANPKGRPARWGWVVYRTAYQPELDGAWATLQSRIRSQMRDNLLAYHDPGDAPEEIVDRMDWIFVEDAAALDGISRDALRRRFQTWAVAEAPDLAGADWARGARYEYFLQANAEALTSVLQPPAMPGTSYVNIVQGWPVALPADAALDADGEPYASEDWMKMALDALYPSNYIDMDNPEMWYVCYRDPEEGAWMY